MNVSRVPAAGHSLFQGKFTCRAKLALAISVFLARPTWAPAHPGHDPGNSNLEHLLASPGHLLAPFAVLLILATMAWIVRAKGKPTRRSVCGTIPGGLLAGSVILLAW